MVLGRKARFAWGALVALGIALTVARDSAAEPKEEESRIANARKEYLAGAEMAKEAQWGEALAAFERSAALRPHALTTFNVGACERVLGRYTRARATLRAALAQSKAEQNSLPKSFVDEANAFLEEIERLLAHVDVEIAPAEAGIAVDGRPLSPQEGTADGAPMLFAGLQAPGIGQPPPAGRFELVLDPGTHVLTLSRKGYADTVLTRSFAPGTRGSLNLVLERLPATLHVASNVEGAIVTVNGKDLGPVPVDVVRPAGTYRVRVSEAGYVPYDTQIRVRPGEESNLRAALSVERVPLTKRWWFWTGAVAVVAGGVALTYALTRPEPQPPPFQSGSTGWIVNPQ